MNDDWAVWAVRRLTDFGHCPACGGTLVAGVCQRCGLDLTGEPGGRLADASLRAAEALRRREDLLAELTGAAAARAAGSSTAGSPPAAPVRPAAAAPGSGLPQQPPSPTSPRPGAAGPPAPSPYRAGPAAPRQGAPSTDVSGILAVAGAGLVAAAAVVFAFFMFAEAPLARWSVLLAVTAGAVLGARWLRRRGMSASAEAVAALAVVLAVVDAWMLVLPMTAPARWWSFAGLAALIALAVGLGGYALRIRAWTTSAALLAPSVPLWLAAAHGSVWAWFIALMVASAATVARGGLLPVASRRLDRPLVGERRLLAVVGAVLFAVAVMLSVVLPTPLPAIPLAGCAAGLAIACAVAWAQGGVGPGSGSVAVWRWCAGALWVLAVVVLPVDTRLSGIAVPAVAGAAGWLALIALLLPGRSGSAPRRHTVSGGWLVAVGVAVPGTIATLGHLADLAGPVNLTAVPLRLAVEVFRPVTGAAGSAVPAVVALAALTAVITVASRVPAAVRSLAAPAASAVPAAPGGATPQAGTPGDGPGAVPQPGTGAQSAAGPPAAPAMAGTTMVLLSRAVVPWAWLLLACTVAGLTRAAAPVLLAAFAVLALLLVLAAARLGAMAASRPAPGESSPPPAWWSAWRTPTCVVALTVVIGLGYLSWVSRPTALLGAVAVSVLLLLARPAVPPAARPALVVVGYAYPLVVLGVGLSWAGWSAVAAMCATSMAASATAAVTTLVPRIDRSSWLAVLATTTVPVGLGVLTVAGTRTLWGAGGAALAVVLQLVLVLTRRRAVEWWVRAVAAMLLLPTLAVAVICLGAVALPGSASPVLLPVIAVMAVAGALTAPAAADRLRRQAGVEPRLTGGLRAALEATGAATGAVTVLLAVARSATGADTVLVLCAILGCGAAGVAQRPDRRGCWWAASALWTGMVWSALALWQVGLVEAYTVPPAVAGLVVATVLTRRVGGWRRLAGASLALLIAPTMLLAVVGEATWPRSVGLLGFAVAALAAAVAVRRVAPGPGAWPATLAPSLTAGALAAAAAGTVRALHLAATPPATLPADNARLFAAALAWSAAAAALAGWAGWLLAAGPAEPVTRPGPMAGQSPPAGVPSAAGTSSAAERRAFLLRWWLAPALLLGTAGPLAAIRPTWAVVVVAWLVEVGLLALMLRAVVVGRRREVALPPAWFCWCVALAWAIGGWSLRELRVEVFSLPLGFALFAAGLLVLRATAHGPGITGAGGAAAAGVRTGGDPGAGGRRAWPVGYTGSMATLAPGILATLGPSTLAIWTDPLTWRAVLVVVMALTLMLIGARWLYRAPLVLGAGALPVAVLIVFVKQFGRDISAGPWLVTLAASGGLLLVLAVLSERRRSVRSDTGDDLRMV